MLYIIPSSNLTDSQALTESVFPPFLPLFALIKQAKKKKKSKKKKKKKNKLPFPAIILVILTWLCLLMDFPGGDSSEEPHLLRQDM